MFTSGIKISRRYISISMTAAVFCAVFARVYERFSYGEYSTKMRWMFLLPFLGCGLLGWCIRLADKKVSLWCYRFWNSAVAVWTMGCLVSGIITISGRNFEYAVVYRCVGAVFAVLAMLSQIRAYSMAQTRNRSA